MGKKTSSLRRDFVFSGNPVNIDVGSDRVTLVMAGERCF
jgi:hypothetical protein